MTRFILLALAVLVAAVPALLCQRLVPLAPRWIWWLTSTFLFAGLVGLVAVAMERGDGE